MLVVPAIDLRGGKCVRMKQGDPTTEIEYDDDPVERAKVFVDAGARRLHVIDLDGAFGSGENYQPLNSEGRRSTKLAMPSLESRVLVTSSCPMARAMWS